MLKQQLETMVKKIQLNSKHPNSVKVVVEPHCGDSQVRNLTHSRMSMRDSEIFPILITQCLGCWICFMSQTLLENGNGCDRVDVGEEVNFNLKISVPTCIPSISFDIKVGEHFIKSLTDTFPSDFIISHKISIRV